MEQSVIIEKILSQIKKLDYDPRLYLMERLVRLLKINKNQDKPKQHSLLELNGLGSDIWKNVGVDKYVKNERQWD